MIELLFVITLAELFMGGGGRLLQVGPFTVRMLLFAVCMLVTAVALLFRLRRLDGQLLAFSLILIYLAIHVFGLLVGGIHGAPVSDMLTELQQSLFWVIAPFFALVLQSPEMVHRASWVVRISGLLLALGYFAVLALLAIGRLSILQILPLLQETGEVLIRADNFLFYKGFLYLAVAIIFFVAIRGKYWLTMTVLVAVALVLTLTRGLLLATSIALLFMLAAQGRWRIAGAAALMVAAAAFVVFIYVPTQNKNFTESRSMSNGQREMDLKQIVVDADFESLFIGQGYGALVNDRQNIENTFLWAVWKFGLVGLLFWFLPFFLCAYFYFRVPDRMHNGTAAAFFFGTVLVYLETATNPYLNNPIGLSYVLTALFSLRTLAKPQAARSDQMAGLPR